MGYDGKDFTILNDETIGLAKGAGQLHVRSILKDSHGRLWIGNNGIGVLLVNAGATIDFSKDMGLVSPTSPRNGDLSPNGTLEHVFAICKPECLVNVRPDKPRPSLEFH